MIVSRTGCAGLIAAGLLLSLADSRADSLWQRRDPQFATLFQDSRPRRVGDVLTIVLSENTGIEHKDERDMHKKTQIDGKFNFSGTIEGNSISKKAGASMDTATTANKQQENKSDYTSDHKFLDRMTVIVVDVLPNGNLVVEGHRKRVVSGEMRMLQVRGIVWPAHIGPANTIQSQFIANCEMYYLGKGPATSTTNHGWYGKILEKVWPF